MNGAPCGWTTSPLGHVASVIRGITFPATAKQFEKSEDNICCLRTSNIQREIDWSNVYYVPSSFLKRSDQEVRVGDTLMSMANSYELVGKVALVRSLPQRFAFGAFLAAIRPTGALQPQYLFHLLRTSGVQAELRQGSSQTTNIANISLTALGEIAVPVAPLAEQQRIADKLDAVLVRVEACRERLAKVASLANRLRLSILSAASAGVLTKDYRLNRGDTLDWPRVRADEVCAKVQSGGTPKGGFVETVGVPFLKVYNIVDQQIDFDYRPQFVSAEVHARELGKSRALPGDVLMNIVGPPLGKVAILPDTAAEWNINQAITLFRPSERISSGWLYILLCEGAAIRAVLDRTKGSVGQVNISLSQCRAFEFPVPTRDEQDEVVRRVETLLALVDRLEDRTAQATAATNRLTPALLAKAFRGELVPQDPADEHAAELLRRLNSQPQPAKATRSRRAA